MKKRKNKKTRYGNIILNFFSLILLILSTITVLAIVYTIDVSLSGVMEDIVAETNFTHLNISDNSIYNNLILYFSFDSNISNTTVYDYSLNNNDGTINNFSGFDNFISGIYGGAYDFDGIEDYIDAGDLGGTEENSNLTLSVWVKPSSLMTNNGILSKRQSGSAGSWQFIVFTSSKLFFRIETSAGQDTVSSGSTRVLPRGDVDEIEDWEVPGGFTNTGIGYDNNTDTLWIGDFTNEEIVNVYKNGTKISNISTNADGIQGVTHDSSDDTLWYGNFNSNEVRHTYKNGTDIADNFSTGWSVNGVTYKQSTDTLFVVRNGENVYEYYANNGSLKKTITIEGYSTFDGLGYDKLDDTLWVTKDPNIIIHANASDGSFISVSATDVDSIEDITVDTSTNVLFKNHDDEFHDSTPNGNRVYKFNKIEINMWYHLVAVYNGSDIKYYVNGSEDVTPVSASGTIDNTDDDVWIGGYFSEDNLFKGAIDEVMIFNTSLTSSQISDIYNNQSARFKTQGNHSISQDITSGNNSINVTTDYEALMGSSINLTLWYYNGSWNNAGTQVVDGNNTFNITSSATNLTLNYTYLSDSNQFYSPLLKNNITLETYGGTSTSISVDSTDSTRSDGSYPIYIITGQLKEGYEKSLRKNWKIEFEFNNETHIIKLDNIINKTAIITVSSDSVTFNLTVNETKKLNLDKDNYYDLLIRLDNITSIMANLFIQEINEKIESEAVDEVKTPSEEIIKENNYRLYSVIVVIILIVLIFIAYKKIKKKKRKK